MRPQAGGDPGADRGVFGVDRPLDATDRPWQPQRDHHQRHRGDHRRHEAGRQFATGRADRDPGQPALDVRLGVQEQLGLPGQDREHQQRGHPVRLADLGRPAAVERAEHDQAGEEGRQDPAGPHVPVQAHPYQGDHGALR
jgi:hypothetical protein